MRRYNIAGRFKGIKEGRRKGELNDKGEKAERYEERKEK